MKPLLRFTCVQWTVCIIASIGFAFDIYELLMLPLIVRPALADLVGAKPGTPEFELWVGMLFFVPAMAGGVFGLLSGYLTDLWGRRQVLVGSILLYAFSACAAGFATSIEMLLLLRCTTFIGVHHVGVRVQLRGRELPRAARRPSRRRSGVDGAPLPVLAVCPYPAVPSIRRSRLDIVRGFPGCQTLRDRVDHRPERRWLAPTACGAGP